MQAGAEDLARTVFRDMESEQPARLVSIRNELYGIRSSEFWEISDRGANFDYLTPERKAKMLEFFEWFAPLSSFAPESAEHPRRGLESSPPPPPPFLSSEER